MTNLPLHIEYLLRYHDCVIVPGIGAFVKSWRSASTDSDDTLLPPVQQIGFNASIQSDDGLLAHSLMRREGIPFEEARSLMNTAVEEIRRMLHSDREYTFGRIGTLTLGEEGNIAFSPVPSPFAKVYARVGRRTHSHIVSDTSSSEKESRRFDTVRNYYLPINKRFARVAAAVIFIVAAASTFVVPSLRDNNIAAYQRASVVPLEWNSKNAPAEDGNSATQRPEPAVATEQVTPGDESPARYRLVVATFSTPTECDSYIASLPSDIASGLRTAIGRKVCRVYAASSDNRDELLALMRDTDFQAQFSQAWIWEA